MEKNLILHKEYGLNSTIPICAFCGESKNEIVMLGAAYKEEAPMHMIVDDQPCEACREKLDSGEWKFFIGECEHSGFIKTKALKEVTEPEIYEDLKDHPIFRMEKCFQCMGFVGDKNEL